MTPTQPNPRPRPRWLLPTVALIIAALLLVMMLALARNEAYRTPMMTVVPSARGGMLDVLPEPVQIETAKAVLGETSFIAYLPCTLENEFQAAQSRVMSERLASYGLGFRVYDSRMDRYRQITLFERARLEGAKAIILCMLESAAMNDSLAAAQQAGIPLIFLTPHEPMYGGVLVDTDNRLLGEAAGRTAAQIIQTEMGGSARILLLETSEFVVSDLRMEGIIAALSQDAPNATIAYRMSAATVANGQDIIANALQQGLDFDFIISSNDATAQGAARALELAGVPPDAMPIVSINGDDAARQLIREGRYLRATVTTQRDETARIAVDAAVRLLGGGEVPQYIDLPGGEVYTGD